MDPLIEGEAVGLAVGTGGRSEGAFVG